MKSFRLSLAMAAMLLISTVSFAQNKLAGKWKTVTVDIADQIHVNIEKDSVHIGDKMWEEMGKGQVPDSATKAMTMNMLKSSLIAGFQKMYFTIDEKGGIFESDKNEKVGQYDAAKSTITFTDMKTKEAKTVPVELKDGLLKMTILDEGENIVLWCRKAG